MDKRKKISEIRDALSKREPSIGSWMQLPCPSVAEIMGAAEYDWVAVDLEHGSIDISQLPDIFRAVELGDTLPVVRLPSSSPESCKRVLDAGAGGVIVPDVRLRKDLDLIKDASCWPPSGRRGIGFSRGNLFGECFDDYFKLAQEPLIVAQIEHEEAVRNLDKILSAEYLDAIFIGPYDLSASLGVLGNFQSNEYRGALDKIKEACHKWSVPLGIHIIEPNRNELEDKIKQGYLFLAYSIDAVMLRKISKY